MESSLVRPLLRPSSLSRPIFLKSHMEVICHTEAFYYFTVDSYYCEVHFIKILRYPG
jgi:hypothetical protein